jgi:hypothetical protein
VTDLRRVPVLLESWQIECCGTPPGVSDQVSWTLVLAPAGGAAQDERAEVGFELVARPWPLGPGATSGLRFDPGDEWPTRLDAGGLHVFWRAPAPQRGQVAVTGRLLADHHGAVPDRFPPTVGTVTRVRVRTRAYVPRPDSPRTLVPRGTPRYRDVDRAPDRYARRDARGWIEEEDAVLVDLAVGRPGDR